MGQNVVIIGSTGSIGRSTLDVIRRDPRKYNVLGLTCNASLKILLEQAEEFRPSFVSVYSELLRDELRYALKKRGIGDIAVYSGEEGNIKAATHKKSDIAVISVVGGIGLMPTLAAIDKKKKICLANKETIVCGGQIVMDEARKKRVRIIPIDSEHSAIFQLLDGVAPEKLRRVIITASGGPFRSHTKKMLKNVKVEEALRHPNWSMGAKITVDSASLMNKGLEVIEAMWLFSLPLEKIDVIIHPQSIIHSMVELNDGAVFAQMGYPDMRIPINYALSYPERAGVDYIKSFDFLEMNRLTFEKPDLETFPALKYAYEAARVGGTLPTAMNAANEVAVREFLLKKISFPDISKIVRQVMDLFTKKNIASPTVEDITKIDVRARASAEKLASKIKL
ncbi:MAG TPA: 1-deoxy-D-xylulose-5-phosphate reductoisomerase [Candidatus Wallbacteria bacterium]|nr:1-deoxy-D-xylulose-5-phosphate reductoisomerase [Candidatus Wallbacteria bacterium]